MNYTRHYNNLIERAPKIKPLDYYTEGHHVIPKCIGGCTADGIAYLTPEEHYIAHLLLVKMYPNVHALVYAANMMTISKEDKKRINNKKYGWLRKKHAIAVSMSKKGMIVSTETKAKISQAKKGLVQSFETRQKRSKALKGIPRSIETRAKISKAQKGRELTVKQRLAREARKGIPISDATREKRSKNRRSWKLTPEQCAARKPRGPMSAKHREAISKARKGQTSNNKGKKFTAEHRYKISLSNKITYANKLNKIIEK